MRTLVAVRFDRELKFGRNKPVILTCEDGAESTEVIAKFAHRCERGTNALVAEAISAMFADDQLAIIDHELAFLTTGIIGWRPPWEPDSLGYLNAHLFYETLKGWPVELDRLIGAVEAVSDDRMNEYLEAIPEEWTGPASQENEMIELLRSMRTHIADVVIQLRRVLQ